MTDTKHTPNQTARHSSGPWYTDVLMDELDGEHVVQNDDGQLIASVCPLTDEEEEAANARLIAAAPRLLDAIEHVLIASEDGGSMNDIDWQMLRAAIAEAKGLAA